MKIARRGKRRAGSSVLEFTLIGIPIFFILISTFEMSRGMWNYHLLPYAVKDGTRFASLHGLNCSTFPNTCSVTVAQITRHILDAGAGLPANDLTLTFTSVGSVITCVATSCLTDTSIWPPAAGGGVGSNVQIDGTYRFQSALAMFWPGAGAGVRFSSVNFPASSRETIQF